MMASGFFTKRVRGFRVLDLLALTLLLALALGSYAFKTFAEAQGVDTADVQAKITLEQKRIRLLKAELSHLEEPGRIERLSTQYLGMGPVDPKREVTVDQLGRIAAPPGEADARKAAAP